MRSEEKIPTRQSYNEFIAALDEWTNLYSFKIQIKFINSIVKLPLGRTSPFQMTKVILFTKADERRDAVKSAISSDVVKQDIDKSPIQLANPFNYLLYLLYVPVFSVSQKVDATLGQKNHKMSAKSIKFLTATTFYIPILLLGASKSAATIFIISPTRLLYRLVNLVFITPPKKLVKHLKEKAKAAETAKNGKSVNTKFRKAPQGKSSTHFLVKTTLPDNKKNLTRGSNTPNKPKTENEVNKKLREKITYLTMFPLRKQEEKNDLNIDKNSQLTFN